jgi:mRNA interferase MazF
MYVKSFDKWNTVKKRIDKEEDTSFCRAGEIRWASVGVNVGSEMDGKGDSFNRPCLVVDIFSDKLALVFPMTTSTKKSAGYVPFTLADGRNVSICVHQARTISPKRILKRIQVVSKSKLREIKSSYKKFYRL